ncbi:MAG TPA: autotransporter-associated beta strand repeat-containing protein, partial [Thermoguttaceae bacterium]
FGAPFDPSANHTMTFLAGGATLDTQANNITLDNAIGNGGAGELTKDGNGSLILNASPTYKGATIINNGTLQLGSPGSGVTLPTTTSVNLISSSGATLDTSGNSQTIASLLGLAGEVKLGNGTLTTGSDNISTTFAGTLSGSTGGSLTKVGTGTFTLTGEISYGGVTAINAGTLKINNNLSTTLNAISGAGALTVDGASTVLNASSINVDTLTIGAGAKVTLTQLLGDGSEKVIIPVPEPSLITLIGSTALGMIAYAWRRRKLAL